jgi:hypothetical protein
MLAVSALKGGRSPLGQKMMRHPTHKTIVADSIDAAVESDRWRSLPCRWWKFEFFQATSVSFRFRLLLQAEFQEPYGGEGAVVPF